ncbi:multidrug efflux pump subunit AcrA (membrane-fusion protein) [Rhodopirellula rubra]|uniref:Multidrug efflux pump subunit AcrA (Membrane-fusion protein) n=1 Tax=Aporhodopirellula rubra TaxID=980271 RepID=A0A7W5DVB7_9BACT|nr:efflux RND transporter periplasmic adaptor subunit [Aporhodopirellula rubra]MBB3205215.1 multidrug efflux pump subunit AcrA (membrane-fusion protein) [Aporhodopirellula rubra]
MSISKIWVSRIVATSLTVVAMLLTLAIGFFALTDLPQRFGLVASTAESAHDHGDHSECEHDHPEDEHDHDHAGHSEGESIELSEQARLNLGLETQKVTVGSFNEYIEVPAAVADWPGKTHVAITSPMTGVINAINVSRGELIESGMPLFTLRLTHQDLVQTQEDFLNSLGQLDIEQKEIQRLTSITQSGAVAGKTLIARQYERDKLLAGIRTARQSMLLHGLTESQVDQIERTRELIREVTIYAPTLHADSSLHHESEHNHVKNSSGTPTDRYASMQPAPTLPAHIDAEFLVTQLNVSRGEAVEAGKKLGQLSDYSKVLIEGYAYQRDGEALQTAANARLAIQAVTESSQGQRKIIDQLEIIYIGNEINRETRALPFYVLLTNEVERTEQVGEQRYVSWRYKPGQRMKLRVPVAGFDNAIVVPKEAVAEEGPERYVFVENNDHFDRVAVHVLASDSLHAAIANDGQVWPGQSVAVTGAHQLQMALKNKSGGAIDPHAGHNH